MKKIFIALLSALFVFALAGCSNMPTGPSDSNALINKAKSSAKKINSYAVTTTTTMDVTGPGNEHKTTATTVLRVQKDPYKVYMTRKVVSDKDPSKAQMMEAYLTKNAVYMKSPQGQTKWKKVSSKPSAELKNLLESNSGDLKSELKTIGGNTDYFAISNNGNNYLASFTGKGKEFDSFTDDMAKSQLPKSSELRKYLKNVSENHVEFYYSFDNEKYFPHELEMLMDMTVKNPDKVASDLNVKFHSISKFSDFNKVKVMMPSMNKNSMSDMMK